ncbi:MAG: hypothetical protein IJW97_08850 [Clostridia bacterium]|nr:hypothetical protein [Clostridia bacterium]
MKSNLLMRLLACLLVVVMTLSMALSMVSCANEQPEDKPSVDDTDDTDEQPEEPENARIPTDLPESNFNGAAFTILEWTVDDQQTPNTRWMPWEEADVDDTNGDLINDSVYNRNAAVEEQYGVVISKVYASVNNVGLDYMTTVRSMNTTGDDSYQLLTLRSVNIGTLTLENMMHNIADSRYINLEKPWWNRDSVTSLSLGGNIYWASSELLLRDKGATACIFYNGRIAEDNGFDNLYELAQDGEWTMEELVATATIAATENGDNVWNENDVWGAVCGDDTVNYLYNGAGLKFATITEDGYLEYNFGSDEQISTLKSIFDDVMYAEFYANTFSNPNAKNVKFGNDNVLYHFGMIKDVTTHRQMETNYGILPIPKYDEAQEDYSSLVWMHHDTILGIPATVKNTDMAEIVLEALSAESYYTVYRDFYDTVIMGRSARDQQSKEMLQIIFDTRSFDPGLIWDTTPFAGKILRLSATGTSDIASLWASYKDAIDDCVTELNEKIDELES